MRSRCWSASSTRSSTAWRIRYRLRLRYDDGWYVWEQQGYCTTVERADRDAELVGSGFLKEG